MTERVEFSCGHTLNPALPRAHRKSATVVTACFIPYFPFLPGPKQEIALTQIPGATVTKPELYVGARPLARLHTCGPMRTSAACV